MLAPFDGSGSFEGLAVEHCEVLQAPDAMWDAYREHGDAGQLATQRARFFRATFGPSLATALNPGRPPGDRLAFADALEAALVRRLPSENFEMLQTLAVMVVTQSRAVVAARTKP
ncbi:MAG: hypothetical protein JO326_05400 [Acetobacteraceae bacterium]|nr:hypothetical protein [Acetobacteraceae bacterium]